MGRQLLKLRTALIAALLVTAGTAQAQESGGALADPLPPAAVDPSLATSSHIPLSVVQGGVADTGPALSTAQHGAGLACNSRNPCAVPSPALNHSILTRAS
jgi:hypothetical protein